MTRLRGNTFILLLQRAGNDTFRNPQEYGESKSGITRPNLLKDLIRMSRMEYEPNKEESLAQYYSKYLKGDYPKHSSILPFNNPSFQHGLDERIKNDYGSVLVQMDVFCRDYLYQDDYSLKLLVAGIVDAAMEDETFDGDFDTGYRSVRKEELDNETNFILQPFLASVWNIILLNYPDASQANETYLEWTESTGDNSPRRETTNIGEERAKKITVSTKLPEELLVNTVTEEFSNEEVVEAEEVDSDDANSPRINEYEVDTKDPITQQKIVAQFHVEAKDNGIAVGQLFGDLVIGNRDK